jgi:flagella basal body P-ring formation protein FlgA
LKNSRKTECGAKQFLRGLAVRAAPFALLAWAVPTFAASCQPVEGASILARDFVPLIPAFTTLQPETAILDAPIAGVQRIVLAEDVLRLEHKFQLAPEGLATAVCFEQASFALAAEDLLAVLKGAFQGKDVEIEILDFTRTPVPHGALQFTRAGLEPSGLWHGRVVYAQGRSSSVWAKVRVREKRTWVEAVELLPAGRTIRADQLVLRTGFQPALDPAGALSIASVVGKKPLRMFAPGAAIWPQLLLEPPQVERGDKVSVQVASGGALLQFDAEAESPGHVGDLVFVRNPENGRRFQAKVEEKGKVAIRK